MYKADGIFRAGDSRKMNDFSRTCLLQFKWLTKFSPGGIFYRLADRLADFNKRA